MWDRIKESFSWLSVQVTAIWGCVWFLYSQFPADVLVELAKYKVWIFNVPALMGMGQAITTYMARIRKPPQ